MKEAMKIVELKSENIKRVKAVHLKLDEEGGLVVIGGNNANGKTSVMDSFRYALEGAKVIPDDPIREGQTKGDVEVTLHGQSGSTYKVKRSFTQKGSYLTVEDAGGRSYKSPQKMLDSFIGDLSFDPLAFSRQSPKEQRELLIKLAGIEEELRDNKEKIELLYEERREAGREVKRLEGKLDGEEKPEDAPDEEVDQQNVLAELKAAREQKEENDGIRREAKEAVAEKDKVGLEVERWEDEIQEIKRKLQAAEQQLQDAKDFYEEQRQRARVAKEKAEALEDPDIDAIEEKLGQIEEVNEKVRERRRIESIESELAEAKDTLKKKENSLQSLRQQRKEAVQSSDMPLESLGISDSGVTFDGRPFDQASSSEKLRVSLQVAMQQNPDLRVIRIEDGSLLDKNSMQELKDIAEANDYHIWVERVGEDENVQFVIEDGEVKE